MKVIHDFNRERRNNFINIFSTTTHQQDTLHTFTTTLQNVLGGTARISELKSSAKDAETLVLWWEDFCNEAGFFAFHSYLLDALEKWAPVILYIKRMPDEAKSKQIKTLKSLWMHCKDDVNLLQAIRKCDRFQNSINENFQVANRSSSSQDNLFLQTDGWKANTSGFQHIPPPLVNTIKKVKSDLDDDFFSELNRQLRENDRDTEESDTEQLKKFKASVDKAYKFTDGGYPVPKSFASGWGKDKSPGEIPWPD